MKGIDPILGQTPCFPKENESFQLEDKVVRNNLDTQTRLIRRAVKNLNVKTVKRLIEDGFDVDLPLTHTGMALWSLAMCNDTAIDEGS